MKKALYRSSIALNVLIVGAFIAKRFYYSNLAPAPGQVATASFFDQYNATRCSLFSSFQIAPGDIVFVGNSITEGFPVTEIWGPHFKNRGIGGNQTSHILKRIGNIASGHPRKIFVEGGVNDLRFNIGVDSVARNYELIIDAIRQESPGTELLIQSVFPTAGEYAFVNKDVIKLNEKLKQLCELKHIAFIDVYSAMAKEGALNDSYTADGLHLNGKGYEAWEQAIKEFIN